MKTHEQEEVMLYTALLKTGWTKARLDRFLKTGYFGRSAGLSGLSGPPNQVATSASVCFGTGRPTTRRLLI